MKRLVYYNGKGKSLDILKFVRAVMITGFIAGMVMR